MKHWADGLIRVKFDMPTWGNIRSLSIFSPTNILYVE